MSVPLLILCLMSFEPLELPFPGALKGIEATAHSSEAAPQEASLASKYLVEASDNICGLRIPRALTQPASVDYALLLRLTPECRQIQREHLPPGSPKRLLLLKEAKDRILKLCERARSETGACSVWKNISRRDGRPVTNLTARIARELA